MLTIKASAKPSKIHGIGLFADQDIPSGTVMWRFDPNIDKSFSEYDLNRLDIKEKGFILGHAYHSITSKRWILAGDDACYANHSSTQSNPSSLSFSFIFAKI